MRTIVATAIMLLVLLLAMLVTYILVRRAVGMLISAYMKRRRALLGSALGAWLADESGALPVALVHLRPFADRDLVADLCLARLPGADPRSRARLLAWLQDNGLVSRWVAQLRHRSAWTRAAAVERLALLELPSCVDMLVGTLEDPVFDVRMRAARALGSLGGEPARKALVAALRDESRWSVIRIADLLAEMGPAVVDDLMAAYSGMARAARLATLELIAHAGEQHALPFLVPLLEDLDRDIRARAAAALGAIGDAAAVPHLLDALHDPEWPVRAMAAKALGEFGSEASAAPLAESLRDPEWWVRANAAEALHKLGPRGLDRLVEMLDDSDRFARDQALAALESFGELERRLAWLVSADPAERDCALSLMQVLLARQTRLRIESIRSRQPDMRVRLAIDETLLLPMQTEAVGG